MDNKLVMSVVNSANRLGREGKNVVGFRNIGDKRVLFITRDYEKDKSNRN